MFPPFIIGAAFFGLVVSSLFALKAFDLRIEKVGIGNMAFALCLLPPAICVLAGVDLLSGWSDPFAGADPADTGRVAGRARGRGGLVILAIKFWPYVLIGLGGYVGWQTLDLARIAIRDSKAPKPTQGAQTTKATSSSSSKAGTGPSLEEASMKVWEDGDLEDDRLLDELTLEMRRYRAANPDWRTNPNPRWRDSSSDQPPEEDQSD